MLSIARSMRDKKIVSSQKVNRMFINVVPHVDVRTFGKG